MLIAIVEDNDNDAETLTHYLEEYFASEESKPIIKRFSDGLSFIYNYEPEYDLIFFDIEMPKLNGMEAAKQIREHDQSVAIIFVTNMAKYALQGYEVNAIDYLLKPVRYPSFQDKMKRALRFIKQKAKTPLLVLDEEGNTVRIFTSDILYVEKVKNYTLYHTLSGQYKRRERLSDVLSSLSGLSFSLINSGCIVNLARIDKININEINVGEDILPLARRRRKEFMDEYMRYLSGKGIKNEL